MVYLKIHSTPNGKIIAMCDERLIDSILKEGSVTIDLKRYNDFYKGEVATEAVLNGIKMADVYSANIVGEESVRIAVSHSIIKKENVKKVDGVPYAHAYRV
jgi:hypothetical protein